MSAGTPVSDASPTLHDLARAAARRLEEAGIARDDAARDAALLVRHLLDWDAARWLAERRVPAPAGLADRLDPLVERRTRREPLAYVLGRCEFWGLEFEVTPDVLIPRPETELIVEEALRLCGTEGPARLADIGTGSGCLAVALARAWPSAHVTATDVSPGALSVARRNASRHGVDSRIAFLEGSLLAGARGFELVVSNPPYVDPADLPALAPEVRDHEPRGALVAGARGLALVEAVAHEAADALVAGGWFLCEIGHGQWREVERLLAADARWDEVGVAPDLQAIPRTVRARRL